MPSKIDTGVTGGAPNLLGSLTGAARPLPENADWMAFGTSHVPENCGLPWVWQQCATTFVPAVLGVDEVQLLTITGATGGTFALTVNPLGGGPQTTAPIAFNASAATVQTALEALPNVDPGDIVVTGAAGGPYTFTYAGQYADTPVAQIVSDCTLLTGVGVTCVVTTLVEGVEAAAEVDNPKPLNPGQDAVAFEPFLVEYNAQSCGGIPGDWESLSDRARRGLATRLSNGIALALSSSAPDGSPNQSPNLPGSATDITPGGGPGPVLCTLAGLIQDAQECGATGELFIYAPAWVLPILLDAHLIIQVGNVWKMGPHTFVLDQGFANEGPTGSTPAAAGEAWFYVSGPVEYAAGPLQILDDTTRGVSPRLNRANVVAAQLAIYRFDPCCVFAALATVC